MISVQREGKKQNIHRDNVLVGDIIYVKGGMEIPADGLVLQSVDLKCDESVMTGEPDPVIKQSIIKCIQRKQEIKKQNLTHVGRHEIPTPLMMSGTNIIEGEGIMLVIVVGPNSTQGKIDEILLTQDDSKSPLQEKLETIADHIGQFGLYSAIAILIILLIRFTIERIEQNNWDHSKHWMELITFFILGITVIVVAIPEGLPLAVTLSLAFSTQKMLKDKNLVRKMQACETMGGANNICSDKTGTLTQNMMYLTTLWNYGDKLIELNTEKDTKCDLENYIPKEAQEVFLLCTAQNSNAVLEPKPQGDATELAIIKFLNKCNIDFEQFRKKNKELQYFPFSSQRKRMSKIVEIQDQQRLLIKGASELITGGCNKIYVWENNTIVDIDNNIKQQIDKAIVSMAEKALRTIGIAYKQVYPDSDYESIDNMNVRLIEKEELILVGILGIEDILRPEVPQAIQDSSIKVRMVTGDNKITARAIAKKCGIINDETGYNQVLEGKEFILLTGGIVCKKCRILVCNCPRDKQTAEKTKKSLRVDTVKNQEKFRQIYPNLAVMARSAPEDKYTLVVGLMENGNVVAVTGDGSNDAPALKKADVGFAMGIAGTQVAKNAADIILTDDNFSSIIKAVLWGRNIYDCIRKFLQFQLTVNIVAVAVTLVGGAVIKQELLQPIQMLWVNLIMDTFASLALATEPPQQQLILRAPHQREDYIISRKMFKHIIMQALYQLTVLFIIAFAGEMFLPEYKDDFDNSTDSKYVNYVNQYKYSDPEKKLMHSGRLRSYDGKEDDYSKDFAYNDITPSRHFTFLFNTFVMLQFFNFLNARKINDEINVFNHIFSNSIFFYILIIIIGFQIIFVQFGGKALACYKYGLTIEQYFISIAFGFGCMFWSILIKLVPDKWLPQIGKEQTQINMNKKGSVLNMKRGKSFEKKISVFSSAKRGSQFVNQRDVNTLNYQNNGAIVIEQNQINIEQAGPVE
ncbi:hypothetical protein IMG5_030810 [Ichthyophthirius multifiliis]|uniref:P-type sodium-transporting ATPase4 n=1 Tax=Ichthyophthirius multifiliis TaxID=5932 RepID=G0QLI1_ICHMU|nr:hypothetical protein IMG5_030810 [Ichthyophthirius multifiliis]EGR33929.1 hypothetical protein IMG5_030810 [Ichthyophthirius multifiliis]|eukprot:XP_004039233.1 hypothetical protein IMG5_030810 [Ichthyophthirius multifiliis]